MVAAARQRRPSSQLSSGSSGANSGDGKEAKDPQRCQRCLNHGFERIRKGHNCPYRSQSHLKICDKECDLIDLRRTFNKMIKTLKEEDTPIDVEGTEEEAPESPTGRNPFCANCRAHGTLKPLRGHKKLCQYRNCDCQPCYYINSRKRVMARQVKLRRRQQMATTKKQNEENSARLYLASKADGPLPPLCKPTPTRPVVNMMATPMETESPYGHQSTLIQLGQTTSAGLNHIIFPTTSNIHSLPPPLVEVYHHHHPQPPLPPNFNSYSQDAQRLYLYEWAAGIYHHGLHPSN